MLCEKLWINICIIFDSETWFDIYKRLYKNKVENRVEGQQMMLFFEKSGFILLTAFKAYCAHKPSDPTCVYDKYSGKNTEKGFAKKIETCTFKMKWNPKCSHMRFCAKLFCVFEMRRGSKKPPTFYPFVSSQTATSTYLWIRHLPTQNSSPVEKSLENGRNIHHTTLTG